MSIGLQGGAMLMRLAARVALTAFVYAFVVPAASAQGSLAGVIRDASGAVIPCVTVEAVSPVLIEKARTAVSDGSGQYRIIDLRGGEYTVTFALQGFTTVRREGIQLAGESI